MKFPYPLKHVGAFPCGIPDKILLVYRGGSVWIGFDKNEITLYQNGKGEFFLKGRKVRGPRQHGENPNAIREI